jgi:hypothetical protein
VAHSIDQIIMSLQFQDVTRQEIDGAMSPLRQIGALAEDMIVRIDQTQVAKRAVGGGFSGGGGGGPAPAQPVRAAPAPEPKPSPVALVVENKASPPPVVKEKAPAPAAEEPASDVSAGDILFF